MTTPDDTTPKPCTMPEEIFATHNGNGINPVHFGRWEDAEDCFDEHEPTTKYIRADRYDRLLQTNDILDREIGVMQQEINRLRADLVEKMEVKNYVG